MNDTNITQNKFRLAQFAVADQNGANVPLTAPVAVTFADPTLCVYNPVDGGSGDFIALQPGSCAFTATATAGGQSVSLSGTVTVTAVVVVVPTLTMSVTFGDEQAVPASS